MKPAKRGPDYGYVPEPKLVAMARPAHFLDSLPASYTVSPGFTPPPGAQGGPGHIGAPASCAAWSFLYGVATFMGAQKGGLDVSDPANQVSPAYLYVKQRIQRGGIPPCKGSGFAFYINALKTTGSPNCAVAPYFSDCPDLVAKYKDQTCQSDLRFNIQSTAVVSTSDLDSVRQVLASNRPLAWCTNLYTDFVSYHGDPPVYVGNGILGKSVHCMVLLGYDDSTNAVFIQNSFGANWGVGGRAWIAYPTFQKLAKGAALYIVD